ncbi:MAG: glycine C-acetyltransferase [Candidatus Nitronauta litoralis]|uniref:2-amino-3-ketobutyrate coenzyme A ligase n=1 Tax=Candidatus Nitronauta litoralis TaxID=2705533 RepID=A0A7T0BW78_9BACT|nr:MAG: glycine C-acetyltransferase [Candidatus Nitronauta litoralis]
MQSDPVNIFKQELETIHSAGLYKDERILLSPQQTHIQTQQGTVLNFCANNYLGLANHPVLIQAGKEALDQYGFGMASVRFICGTNDIHKKLEGRISEFLKMEDAILYSSCFDANTGLFETLFDEKDAILSDRLNHASIIDGTRLCKAMRFRYQHSDLNHLETQLKRASKYRLRVIATDGVFSMDGDVARLKEICDLADQYGAMVMVDDSHATGFFGPTGRGSIDEQEVMERVDIVTSTFGKALGGSSGGFTAGRKEMIDLLRQRSRPYLFSNSLSPIVAAVTHRAIDLIEESPELIEKIQRNTLYFRDKLKQEGLTVMPGTHPIVPLMLGDARLAHTMAEELLKNGIYVIGFSFPVVPKDKARIRFQISAAHEKTDIDFLVEAIKKVLHMPSV